MSGLRKRIKTPEELKSKLLERCDRSGGPTSCWNWLLSCNKGYGQFNYNGRMKIVNRLIWIAVNGPIPNGLFVLHKCDNRKCINPSHLFLGTQYDNMRDMRDKDRGTQGEEIPQSILTEKDVRHIRKNYVKGVNNNHKGNSRKLANKFGIHLTTLYDVVNFRTWRHVQ